MNDYIHVIINCECEIVSVQSICFFPNLNFYNLLSVKLTTDILALFCLVIIGFH